MISYWGIAGYKPEYPPLLLQQFSGVVSASNVNHQVSPGFTRFGNYDLYCFHGLDHEPTHKENKA